MRRLARPVGAEQAEHRALLDVEIDAVERPYLAVGLHQPLHAHGGRRTAVARPREGACPSLIPHWRLAGHG